MRLYARFQDPVALDYVAPTDVVFTVMDPDGVLSTPDPQSDPALETPDGIVGPGYYADVDLEAWGRWHWRVAATGAGQAADEGTFYVERSFFDA